MDHSALTVSLCKKGLQGRERNKKTLRKLRITVHVWKNPFRKSFNDPKEKMISFPLEYIIYGGDLSWMIIETSDVGATVRRKLSNSRASHMDSTGDIMVAEILKRSQKECFDSVRLFVQKGVEAKARFTTIVAYREYSMFAKLSEIFSSPDLGNYMEFYHRFSPRFVLSPTTSGEVDSYPTRGLKRILDKESIAHMRHLPGVELVAQKPNWALKQANFVLPKQRGLHDSEDQKPCLPDCEDSQVFGSFIKSFTSSAAFRENPIS
ncbi:hypothetical protein Tco_0015259 [Tanacetum coccineum]